MRRRAGIVFGLALLSSCGAHHEEQIGSEAASIQYGHEDDAHPFAVEVLRPRSVKDSMGALCSGALIAPNLVVTARHCVIETPPIGDVDCATSRFGAVSSHGVAVWVGPISGVGVGEAYDASDVVVPSDTEDCGNDLALLVLSQDVPANVATPATPSLAPPLSDLVSTTTHFAAIGYGLSSPTSDDSGTRRILENVPITCVAGSAPDGCFGLTQSEFLSGNGLCDGDSGSGAFEQVSVDSGAPVVLGVLARGSLFQKLGCGFGIYTRLDSRAELVRRTAHLAARVGGYTAPVWAGSAADEEIESAGGVDTKEGPFPLGATCQIDSDCNAGACRTRDGTHYTCAEECTPGSTASWSSCRSGFVCTSDATGQDRGVCFPDTNAAAPPSGNRGCSFAPSSGRPFAPLAAGVALVLLALFARRRRRPSLSGCHGVSQNFTGGRGGTSSLQT